jgi:hypothetical protein
MQKLGKIERRRWFAQHELPRLPDMLGNGAGARWRVAEQIGATDQALFGPEIDQKQRHRPNDCGACPQCKGQRDANGTGADVARGQTRWSTDRWNGHVAISSETTSRRNQAIRPAASRCSKALICV